jgi:hypothetical protein
MTSIDATYGYEPALTRAGGLDEGAQRVLMALLGVALLAMLLLPNPQLTKFTGYADPGGNSLFKIHFYSYTLFLALLFVSANVGAVRFLSRQIVDRPGVVQFASVVMLCAAITIARQGIGGVAYMVDTLLAAPLAVMLLSYLDAERRLQLTAFVIWFVTFNAAVAVGERVLGFHLFDIVDLYGFAHFRATAFMGHPLANALVTSSMMILTLAMPWSAWRKAFVLSVCLAGILAFGARGGLAITVVMGAAAALFFGARALLRGELRLSTLVNAPLIGTVAVAAGAVLTLGTVLGERIVALARFDESAEARVNAFKLFDYLSTSDLLYGVDFAEVNFILKIDRDVNIIENCWIAILLMLGAVLFVVFALSLLGFFRSISRGRGAIAAFAVANFVLVASTNNSLSTKSPALVLFCMALVGIPLLVQRGRSQETGVPVRYETPLREGVWS